MFITVVSSWNYLLWCPFGNAGHFRHENHILGNIIKRQINTVQTTKHKERRNTYVLNFCDMTGTTGMISVIFSLIFSYSRLVSSFFFMSRLSWEDAVMIHWWEKPLVVTLFEFSLNRAHVVGGMRSTTGQASPLLMQRSAPAGPS